MYSGVGLCTARYVLCYTVSRQRSHGESAALSFARGSRCMRQFDNDSIRKQAVTMFSDSTATETAEVLATCLERTSKARLMQAEDWTPSMGPSTAADFREIGIELSVLSRLARLVANRLRELDLDL
jgi:hypothetical protein